MIEEIDRLNLSNFLIKLIYYTYWIGLLILIFYSLTFPIIFFTPLVFVWYFQFAIPIAGFLGVNLLC